MTELDWTRIRPLRHATWRSADGRWLIVRTPRTPGAPPGFGSKLKFMLFAAGLGAYGTDHYLKGYASFEEAKVGAAGFALVLDETANRTLAEEHALAGPIGTATGPTASGDERADPGDLPF